MPRIVECVPNLSEGCNTRILDLLQASLRGVRFLDRSSDPDHNRSVFTFAGEPDAVLNAATSLAEAAIGLLNLADHQGVHPRIGVLDVLPFVPVFGLSLADCSDLAHRAAHLLWEKFRLPTYLYEAAGTEPLEAIRRQARSGAPPHVGTCRHSTAGAVAIGAREFLIAWNIWLDSDDLALAKRIAATVRASGGGFPGVKALGLPLPSRNLVQVSLNTVNFAATPLHVVFKAVQMLAAQAGAATLGSELIGLIPERALQLSQGHDLQWMNWRDDAVFERRYSKESVSHLSP